MTITEQMKLKKILKRDVCEHLGITMPTLKVKLEDNSKLTLNDVQKLRELGIKIEI